MSDAQVQQRIWETRCPELLAECERLRAALATARVLPDSWETEAQRTKDWAYRHVGTKAYHARGRSEALRDAARTLRVALGEADGE